MEAPQAQHERTLYVALKPDQVCLFSNSFFVCLFVFVDVEAVLHFTGQRFGFTWLSGSGILRLSILRIARVSTRGG